jgi:hypothetical protein
MSATALQLRTSVPDAGHFRNDQSSRRRLRCTDGDARRPVRPSALRQAGAIDQWALKADPLEPKLTSQPEKLHRAAANAYWFKTDRVEGDVKGSKAPARLGAFIVSGGVAGIRDMVSLDCNYRIRNL